MLLSGPAGTGKSRACMEFMHACCIEWPGMRALITRKTRASLTESALVTWETKVLQPGDPVLRGAGRMSRQAYKFPNGSVIVAGGLDNPTRTFSTEYDLIYVQEAIELTEDEWEKLLRPLRNGVMPYQQLIADTNPDSPQHWLYKRCMAGKCMMLNSRHEDNPSITPEYISMLDRLTGPRRERLRFGRWVQAEGVIYEGWEPATHLIDKMPEGWQEWDRYWTIDWGYNNPIVLQFWAVDGDGRMYLYREVYRSGLLVEDLARMALDLSKGEPRPKDVICDHDLEDRATFERHSGLNTIPARKAKGEVLSGIQNVASRLRIAGDGRPRLFVLRDSLVSRCQVCSEKKLPTSFAEEIPGYVWDTRQGRRSGEEPLKENDHACDAARYMACHLDMAPYKTIQAW